MIDISGRAVRAGIRSITAVATASCFAVMPQVTNNASAHTGDKAARTHGHTTPHRDHDGREARDHGHGRADLVVDTKGPRGAIVPGRTYKWPFEVTNKGNQPAKDVSLTATPDRSLRVLAAPPKCRWRKSGPLVCNIGLLPQGQTKRGTITARVAPRTHRGRSLSNPVQVSWHNAPLPERRMMAAFPPVEVSPDGTTDPRTADARVPYPLMVTEHGPVTAESVVVRSPIGVPAPDGPCANGVQPGDIAGKTTPIKPALGPCGAKQDDPAACGCAAAHDVPLSDRPAVDVVPHRPTGADAYVPDKPIVRPGRPAVTTDQPATADRPITAPCGAVAARPVVIPDRPIVPPCAHHRPATVPEPAADQADQPITAPCGVTAPRPAAVPDRPIVPPCAHHRPATTPCGALADRPVILPAPVLVPNAPVTPPCAGVRHRPGAEQAGSATDPAADKPAATTADDKAAKADDKAKEDNKTDNRPAGIADRPVATPCGAGATNPVVVPGQPVVVPNMPAIPPCAQGRPRSCGCLNAEHAPAATAAEPVIPAVPVVPAVPGRQGVAPCAAEDKPMATDKTAAEHVAPSCGTADNAPAAVHEEPATTPDTIEPMTPLTGPGKAAHHPLGRPHHHFPPGLGRAHHDCVRQGTGFVCPLGSAPHHRPHVLNLHSPGHPHVLHCVGAASAGCHTREARPIAVRPQPVRGNLPTTGSSSGLLALSGLGLAGAGMVLYRLSRARRRGEAA